jgi:hypothetical protein
MRGQGFACRLIPGLVHGLLDIGDLESGFVVAHGGASRSVIHCNAFNTRHLANPLFHFVRAQYRQHVVDFKNGRFHRTSLVGFMLCVSNSMPFEVRTDDESNFARIG